MVPGKKKQLPDAAGGGCIYIFSLQLMLNTIKKWMNRCLAPGHFNKMQDPTLEPETAEQSLHYNPVLARILSLNTWTYFNSVMFRACRDEGTLYEGKPGRESRVWTKINRNLQDLNAIKVYTEHREPAVYYKCITISDLMVHKPNYLCFSKTKQTFHLSLSQAHSWNTLQNRLLISLLGCWLVI